MKSTATDPGRKTRQSRWSVPGTMMLTGLEEMDSPVPFNPNSLIGAGLQTRGRRSAVTLRHPDRRG